MSGGGRGRLRKRSPSPDRKKWDPNNNNSTPRNVDQRQQPVRNVTQGAVTRPPTKQQQRQGVRTRSPGVDPRTSPPPRYQFVPRWPRVGDNEVTDDGHLAAVATSTDVRKLFRLWCDLVDQEPHRSGLIRTVERQLIRAQLHGMMGKNISTRANIQLDGVPSHISPLRNVKAVRHRDKERWDGTERQNLVWNSSTGDAEVDTIRDLKAWAGKQTRETLANTDKVLIQLVGTSGPCEACKRRIAIAANEIVDYWHAKTGLRKDQLPEVEVYSYYGNPPKPWERQGYDDVFNGWKDDYTPSDLWFRRQDGGSQSVREHRMVSVNSKAEETTTEKPDKSTEEPETTTEKPDTSTTKSSTSQDLVTTDR